MKIIEKCKEKVKPEKAIAAITAVLVLCVFSVAVSVIIASRQTTLASTGFEEEKEMYVRNSEEGPKSEIDILNILDENTKNKYREEFISEEIDLEYTTVYEDNESLPKGMIQVLQEGRTGKQLLMTKKIYLGEELIKEEQLPNKIVSASFDKIVQVGTAKYSSNYKVQVGDTLYVTPDTLGVMEEPNKDSEKLYTIHQESPVELIEIQKEWYRISYGIFEGYVPSNCLTYLKPKSMLTGNIGEAEELSKDVLLSKLAFNMRLDEPSGLTLEQFGRILSGNSQDKNNVFENNAQYFYYIERQYNINGVFVAALGIHESAWGTSAIARNKRNLFGYGASDSNPYTNAYSYNDYSESIDLIARVLVKYYINPSGVQIYDGQIASGAYYNGATLSGINQRYATDKNWANAVYNHMKSLYNNL